MKVFQANNAAPTAGSTCFIQREESQFKRSEGTVLREGGIRPVNQEAVSSC